MKNYTIATLGSHSSLQILKGAKDENFRTLLITTPDRVAFYKRFSFIDDIMTVTKFSEFPSLEQKLRDKDIIIIPHGSFVAYLGLSGNKKMLLPYFGNKNILDWEGSREKQFFWLEKSGINLPPQYQDAEKVTSYPVIVKSDGAKGGQGYFLAGNSNELKKKLEQWPKGKYIIQQYMLGVTAYFHYFYSPLTDKLELMSMDRRYETNVDGLARLPVKQQEGLVEEPSFVVVGNSPLVIRESLLPEIYAMGEKVVAASKKIIDEKGLYGPFCLETIITPDQKIYCIEISCRIVAGTNLFPHGSPYTWLQYNEPMSTGRRIAREIKLAVQENKLDKILD